jgi:uncharacterized protein YfkK (UPF0435 family)
LKCGRAIDALNKAIRNDAVFGIAEGIVMVASCIGQNLKDLIKHCVLATDKQQQQDSGKIQAGKPTKKPTKKRTQPMFDVSNEYGTEEEELVREFSKPTKFSVSSTKKPSSKATLKISNEGLYDDDEFKADQSESLTAKPTHIDNSAEFIDDSSKIQAGKPTKKPTQPMFEVSNEYGTKEEELVRKFSKPTKFSVSSTKKPSSKATLKISNEGLYDDDEFKADQSESLTVKPTHIDNSAKFIDDSSVNKKPTGKPTNLTFLDHLSLPVIDDPANFNIVNECQHLQLWIKIGLGALVCLIGLVFNMRRMLVKKQCPQCQRGLAIDEPLMSHCEKPTTRERQAPNV